MENITKLRRIYASYYNGDLSNNEMCSAFEELPVEILASFISDAISQGWIDRFNMGVSEDGELI